MWLITQVGQSKAQIDMYGRLQYLQLISLYNFTHCTWDYYLGKNVVFFKFPFNYF